MMEYLKYAGILLGLIIIQKTAVSFIDVTEFKITPDLVIIGLVYIGVKRGKITGSIAGFASGLILDIFSFSFIGLMALAKTIAGFTSGFFNNEQKTERYLNSYIFVLLVSICSIINNTIYYTFYFQGTNLLFLDILIRYVLPTTVYTALFSVIPVIFARRRRFAR
ncbi:MAG TPA: rod shape-determining protein MreD [Ignavibacteria bacterium]|nr:rod shape-determining protein MreD [Ignavibacteria bacterium]HMR00316.1 rod shape-determining protein MreD [Ignavibacteria bacterium]